MSPVRLMAMASALLIAAAMGADGDWAMSCAALTLRLGDMNDCVKVVQRALRIQPADGRFDRRLESRVAEFQRTVNLNDDGIVGEYTWSIVYCTAPLQVDQYPYFDPCTVLIQYMIGMRNTDGYFTSEVAETLNSFQSQHGLAVTSTVDSYAWNELHDYVNGGTAAGRRRSSIRRNGCKCEHDYAEQCADRLAGGAQRLRDYITSEFGGQTSDNDYRCATAVGEYTRSLHGEGRAVDVYVDRNTGHKIMSHLISIACGVGIQEIIFDGRMWAAGYGESAYPGSDAHTDRIHVGLNRCGGRDFAY